MLIFAPSTEGANASNPKLADKFHIPLVYLLVFMQGPPFFSTHFPRVTAQTNHTPKGRPVQTVLVATSVAVTKEYNLASLFIPDALVRTIFCCSHYINRSYHQRKRLPHLFYLCSPDRGAFFNLIFHLDLKLCACRHCSVPLQKALDTLYRLCSIAFESMACLSAFIQVSEMRNDLYICIYNIQRGIWRLLQLDISCASMMKTYLKNEVSLVRETEMFKITQVDLGENSLICFPLRRTIPSA